MADATASPLAPPTAPTTPAATSGPLASATLQQFRTEAEKEKGAIESSEQKRGELMREMKPPPTLEQPPQPQGTSSAQQWGSTAMMMAALGGFLSRNHLTTALNAASGVMEGYRKMDAEAASAALDRWKLSNDNAKQMYDWQTARLKMDLEAVDADENSRLAMFNIDAKTMGMNFDFIQTTDDAKRTVAEMERTADNHAEVTAKVLPQQVKNVVLMRLFKSDAFQSMMKTDPQKAYQTLQDATAPKRLYGRSALSMAAAKWWQDHPDGKQADFARAMGNFQAVMLAQSVGLKADSGSLNKVTAQMDAAHGYAKGALASLDSAIKFAEKNPDVIPTDMGPVINEWVQNGMVNIAGNPKIPEYAVLLLTAAGEYGKVITGATGAAAATEGARKEGENLFRQGFNIPAIKAARDGAAIDMDNKINAYRSQAEEIKERMAEDASSAGEGGDQSNWPPAGSSEQGSDGRTYISNGGDPSDPSTWSPQQ